MTTAPRSSPPRGDASSPLRRSAKIIGLGLAFFGAAQLAGAFLVNNAVGAAAVQAAIAEWGASTMAIAWSDPNAPPPTSRALLVRAARGAAIGMGAGALVVAFALVTRASSSFPNGPAFGQLLLGVLASVLVAVRDELLLRGVALTALDGWVPVPARIGACAIAAAAAAWGAGHVNAAELASAALAGAALASLWLRDRGAWMAVGANAAYTWTTGSVVRGGLLDVRSNAGAWGGGDAGLHGGVAAVAMLAVLAAAAIAWAIRARRAA